jgi:hypothetical protein
MSYIPVGKTVITRILSDLRAAACAFMKEWQADTRIYGEVEADESGLRKVGTIGAERSIEEERGSIVRHVMNCL